MPFRQRKLMSRGRRGYAIYLIQLLVAACSAGELNAADLTATDENFSAILDSPIYQGDEVFAKTGLVRISTSLGSCTGTLVGPRLILTAAHCMPPTGTKEKVTIRYYRPGRSSDLTTGESLGEHQVVAARRSASLDANHDIGLLILDDPTTISWKGTDYRDYVRIYSNGSMPEWFDTYGAGGMWRHASPDGRLRVGHFKREELHPLRAVLSSGSTEEGHEGICKGDSGGPSMFSVGNQDIVAGITSQGDAGDDLCADDGEDWQFTRPSGTNGDFLKRTAPECRIINSSGYGCLRCYELPFISDVADIDVKFAKPVAIALLSTITSA
jgi:Trypsin